MRSSRSPAVSTLFTGLMAAPVVMSALLLTNWIGIMFAVGEHNCAYSYGTSIDQNHSRVDELMTTERDEQRSRAAQAGFVMRAYRESFVRNDGRRGLTQEELLRRMSDADPDYEERYSHATVSRWESGATRPNASRLRVFGKALDLSEAEVAGLILLSGLAPDFNTARQRADQHGDDQVFRYPEVADGGEQATVHVSGANHGIWSRSSSVNQVGRFLMFWTLPLAIAIVAVGYALALVGWESTWTPVAYVGLVLSLVLGRWLLFSDAEGGLRELFWVTLFVLLTTPLLQFAPLRMDHYNFHLIDGMAGTPTPYMSALLCNLVAASLAGLTFQLLWRWQNTGDRANQGAHIRAAWAVMPPIAALYLGVVVCSNASVWVQLAVLMPVVAAIFVAMLVVRDPTIRPSDSDRRLIFATVVIVTVFCTAIGMAVVAGVYLLPHAPTVLPDHNLIRSWELDLGRLGYTRQEALDLVNLGYLWHAICLFIYMFFVVGSNFIVAIYRMGNHGAPTTPTETSSTPASAAAAEYAQPLAGESSPLPP